MGKKAKTRRLTVLLLKDSIKSFKAALREPDKPRFIKIKQNMDFKGEFWYAAPESRTPSWLGFLASVLEQPLPSLYGRTVSAVLFVAAGSGRFAFTFGYGRNLLRPDCYELGFGLKVALNRIDHRQIRSVDIRAYEELAMSTRKQASRSADLTPFGLDVARDLLRAVTGEPSDRSFAKRLTGTDALTMNLEIDVSDLGEKCNDLLKAYHDNTYRTHFGWIDHLREVRDSKLVESLNHRLVKAIRQRQTEKLHLAAPEPLAWQSLDCFRISGTRQHEYEDLDIDEYLSELGEKRLADLTVDKLKSYHVSVRYSDTGTFQSKWTVFSCLVWETKIEGVLYALLEGKWFQVEEDFAGRVNQFVATIPEFSDLPSATPAEKEEAYNRRVSDVSSGAFLCLDRKLVKPQDAVTEIEFCDLLSKEDRKRFVHVKRRSRSSTLSHLFAQGTVAARAFLADGTLREAVRQRLRLDWQSMIPDRNTRPTPSEYEVVYAVITKSGKKATELPFFSQLNLMQHAKLLQELGYMVAFASVPEDDEGTEAKTAAKKQVGCKTGNATPTKLRVSTKQRQRS